MRTFIALVSLILGMAPLVEAQPDVRLSPRLIKDGQSVSLEATGFTPKGNILAHLVRPDGTEYPEMQFVADAGGKVSHTIRIILIQTGTYELQMIDLASKAVAVSRFMVVEGTVPKLSSSDDLGVLLLKGAWQGTISRAPESQTMMVTLSGGETGAVVGTVAYPSLACGGELWQIGSPGEGSVLLGEHITYGEDRCTGHGIVSIRPVKDGALEIQRTDAEHPGAPPAVGTLPKRM
jgi:hypothetical protein